MKGVAYEAILIIGVLVAVGFSLFQLRGILYGQQLTGKEEVVYAFAKDLESVVDKAIATTGDAAFVYYPSIKQYSVVIKNNTVTVLDKVSNFSAYFSKYFTLVDNSFEDCEKIFVFKKEEKIFITCKCFELGEACSDSLQCCSGFCNMTSGKCEEMPVCPASRVCTGAPEAVKIGGKDCCPADKPVCNKQHCCPVDRPKWCEKPTDNNPRCMNESEYNTECKSKKPTLDCNNIKSPSDLPPSWDWRNVNGENWMTPVKSQGLCGSCWAFSTVGTIESTYKIEQADSSLNPDLSEQDLVSCSNAGSCSGGLLDPAFRYVKTTGICDENCFPYKAADVPCSDKCSNWKNNLWKINDFNGVHSIFEIKRMLICNGPLSVGLIWPGGGGHAVVLVGYDDTIKDCMLGNDGNGCWIIKNSWGTGWGNNGYGTIGYDTGGIDSYGIYVIGVQAP